MSAPFIRGRREPGETGSRRPASLFAGRIVGMVLCVLIVVACGFGPRDDSASGQVPPMPAYDVGPDDSPVASWQARTADTVARTLTRQETGVVIAETATGEPRIAEALRAAAALRQLGWRTKVNLGIGTFHGLVREGSQEPLSLTRLQVLATGETTSTMRAAVRARLQSLRPRLIRHEPDAVIATSDGLDVLDRGGDLRTSDLPTHDLCPTSDENRVVVAASLLSIAKRAGLTCGGATGWVERAAHTVMVTDPTTPQGHEEILSAGRFLADFGHRVDVPDDCLGLLRHQSTYRELISPIAYQTCAEVVELAGATIGVDARVASDLELLAETGGRVDDALQIDATGLHYSVLVLRLLGFSEEHIDAVRETPPVTNGTAPDTVRVALATFAGSDLPAELARPHPVTSPDDSYAAALAVNVGGACPDTWQTQPSWQTTGTGAVDSFELLRHATIVAAQATCSSRPVPAAERRRILEAGHELHRRAWNSERGIESVTDLWKASESTCLMGVEPDLSDSVVPRLPDYSTLTTTPVNLGQLVAAVRLSDIARHGCGPDPWPLAGE